MKCPKCGDEISFMAGDAPVMNVANYGAPAIAKSSCCKTLIHLYPIRKIKLVVSESTASVDEWGF